MSTDRSRFGIIFLTVFVDLVGFGLILPILPVYAQRFGARGLGFGALLGAFSLMQFVATMVLGRLSDRVGRRPILLTTILFNALGYALFAYAGSYPLLFIARLISGFAGGNVSVAQAYAADITPPGERAKGMGIIGAAFGMGFAVGPAVGGFSAYYLGTRGPGLVAAGLSLANFVCAYFILNESLAPEHRASRPLIDFGHMGAALTKPRTAALMIAFALMPFAFAGYMVALPLHAASRFSWGERQLAGFFTLVGITAAVVQGYLVAKLTRRVGERPLVILGALGMAVAIAVVPYLYTSTTLYGWTIALAFANGIAWPAAMGMISQLADATEQGAMLGAAQSLSAIGRFTGPVAVGEVYDSIAPTAAFLAAGVIMGLAWAVALRIPKNPPVPLP